MYKSFQIISDFVKDMWESDFLVKALNPTISRIPELKRAYQTMISILNERRKPSTRELTEDIYPLLEVSVPWKRLKDDTKLPPYFLSHYRPRLKTQGNYYGSIFEIKIASFCLLSGWDIAFPEDYTEKEKQIDFVLVSKAQPHTVAVECTSKRLTQDLTYEKLKKTIEEKAKKFKPECIDRLSKKLPTNIDEKLLVIDITRADYSNPKILGDLSDFDRKVAGSTFDGVTLVWTEDIPEESDHSLRPKSRTSGASIPFAPEVATEIHATKDGSVLFTRKYVEPEPAWGVWGHEETNQ